MRFKVVLFRASETRSFAAVVSDLPGCCSQGDMREEALRNVREATQLYLALGEVKARPGEEVAEKEFLTAMRDGAPPPSRPPWAG